MSARYQGRLFGFHLIGLAGWLVFPGGGSAAEPAGTDAVALKVVKYAQVADAVKAHRGKIVVVDVWGEF
jgi:hypothetical protein